MDKSLKESIEQLNTYTNKIQDLLETNYGEEPDVDINSLLDEYGLTFDDLEKGLMNGNMKMSLGYKKLSEDAIDPKYNYETDSGFDLYSTEEVTIDGLGRALVPTGLCFDIKDGYEIQVRSKSGLAINQGLMCLNSPGTVDNGYTGEVKVIIFNTNKEPFTINKGMKIAQAVLCPVVNGKWVELIEKEELTNKDRNNKGFGSTGI